MSSRSTLPLRLSPKARQDFTDILRYTGETWGKDQLFAYRDKLNDVLEALRHNPLLGHRREDLPPPLLAYLVGSHVVVYRVNTDDIGVARILHQRMSLTKHV